MTLKSWVQWSKSYAIRWTYKLRRLPAANLSVENRSQSNIKRNLQYWLSNKFGGARLQKNTGQNGGKPKLDLNVEAAWAQGITGKNVTTAIMDDGKYKFMIFTIWVAEMIVTTPLAFSLCEIDTFQDEFNERRKNRLKFCTLCFDTEVLSFAASVMES